jgi:hypothetical protein
VDFTELNKNRFKMSNFFRLLGYDFGKLGRNLSVFRANVLPPHLKYAEDGYSAFF